eukprot:GGOE01053487.1.p1 GENE.GGOE01053487.1~~GGOE01053487.1.p1  ORF type:complete len:618 (-),score=258.25 GGOE01053487.1:1236-3053(-)
MIDGFTIFHKGGRVLWSKSNVPILGSPINQLIKTVLLEERTSDNFFIHDAYKLHWLLANEFELVFVVVYQKILQLLYIDELLQQVKDAFCELHRTALAMEWGRISLTVEDFDATFVAIMQRVEEEAERKRHRWDTRSPPPGASSSAAKGPKVTKATLEESPSSPQEATGPKPSAEEDREAQLRKVLATKGCRTDKGAAGKGKKKEEERKKEEKAPVAKASKRVKQMSESWKEKGPEKAAAAVSEQEVQRFAQEFAPKGEVAANYVDWEVPDREEEEEDDSDAAEEAKVTKPAAPQGKSRLERLFGRIPFTDKVLDDEDLQPLMVDMRQLLVTKNVAADIADKLCNSVVESLRGTTVGKFSRVSVKVREAMEKALVRILTPKRDVNLLRDIAKARALKRPFVITFCGVNGVGKSTNLAKICYWLTHNGQKVLIAACDTFRSGAVEQLRIHAQCLGVPLFERGYGKDAATIAAEAINHARKEGCDVVLVDTAGRMQDNEPLMRSLTKLINVNNPDLILFVGEALVGNDGVDQVVKFNAALRDLSDKPNPRLIDGIVLTKFDTIDDKVGASISMVYATGQPIVFVGVGQTYTDLKRLNAAVIVDLLLK